MWLSILNFLENFSEEMSSPSPDVLETMLNNEISKGGSVEKDPVFKVDNNLIGGRQAESGKNIF